jgi:hypothetical protein
MGKWCEHCTPGHGCKIYESRPIDCKTFECAWLRGVGEEEDKPNLRKVVLDYVNKPGLPTSGLAQLWETTEGSLASRYARETVRKLIEGGVVVTCVPLRGSPRVYIPDNFDCLERQQILESIYEQGFVLGLIQELK